jgi:hypothetical protein
MSDTAKEGKPEAGPREHRFAFGRRWEERRASRSHGKMWTLFAFDLALLILIVLLSTMMVRRFG